MITSVISAVVSVSFIRVDSQTWYSSAVRWWSVAIRQVARNRVPSQIEKTVLVLPQSMARSISRLPSEMNLGRRDGAAALRGGEDQRAGVVDGVELAGDARSVPVRATMGCPRRAARASQASRIGANPCAVNSASHRA
jgi:hypothetical protein